MLSINFVLPFHIVLKRLCFSKRYCLSPVLSDALHWDTGCLGDFLSLDSLFRAFFCSMLKSFPRYTLRTFFAIHLSYFTYNLATFQFWCMNTSSFLYKELPQINCSAFEVLSSEFNSITAIDVLCSPSTKYRLHPAFVH